jgi:hypothetical protein
MIREQKVLHTLQVELNKPAPIVRKAIRARALATLPAHGGLNKWAAAIQIRTQQQVRGTTIMVKLKGGRNSQGGRSDVNRLDKGKARHPAWGRRGKGQWSTTTVRPGFFSEPASDPQPWIDAADRALDKALEGIR